MQSSILCPHKSVLVPLNPPSQLELSTLRTEALPNRAHPGMQIRAQKCKTYLFYITLSFTLGKPVRGKMLSFFLAYTLKREKSLPKPNFPDMKTCHNYTGPGFQLLLQHSSCKNVPLKQLAYHVKFLRKASFARQNANALLSVTM